MKAQEVLKTLRISRPTLCKYAKEGKIKYKELPSGQYDYDETSVFNLLSKGFRRKTVIYARVSTKKQKENLSTQVEVLRKFCFMNGWVVSNIYEDIASGIDFTDRERLFDLLNEVISHNVERIVISYKDRLSRIAFSFFDKLFKQFGCEIVVMSEVGNPKLDSEEVFDEIISLLHCYSMKLYSKRTSDKKTLEISLNAKD